MQKKKDTKAKVLAKLDQDQWEHDEKQAEVRQKVDKVQGFDDAIASRIEQASMGEAIRKGAAGQYFKRLDTNKECATRMLSLGPHLLCRSSLPHTCAPQSARRALQLRVCVMERR